MAKELMMVLGFNGSSVYLDLHDIKVVAMGTETFTVFTQSGVIIKATWIGYDALQIMKSSTVDSITTRDHTIFVSMERLEFEKVVGILQHNGLML